MKRILIILVGFLYYCMAGCCNVGEMNNQFVYKYQDEGFSLRIPKDIRVEKQTPVEDFNLYRFFHEDKTLASAYIGNQPSFPKTNADAKKVENGLINGLSYKCIHIKDADGNPQTHVLVRFSESRDWPMYMHFWYSDLSPNLKEKVRGIIFSVQER